MNTGVKLPFYARISLLVIGLYFFIRMLSITQAIILPVIYATIIAILISPAINFLVNKKINRAVSIALVMLSSVLALAGLLALLSAQASRMSEAWPQLTLKFQQLLTQTIAWVAIFLDISVLKINTWLTQLRVEFFNSSSAAIGSTISTVGGIVAAVMLIPVYIFMILFYQPQLVEFIHKLFGADNDKKVSEILIESKTIIQSYLIGLFAELAIIAVLNSIGLLALGIDYAILLGITGALLNIIPYLGGIIAMTSFAIIALVTKSPAYVIYVIALYSLIQFVDNNLIVPKIVGSKVKLNALVSLFVVIAGAALWGVPGMFISIPLLAIVKVILDRVEPLKPWGFLLGDVMPPLVKINLDLSDISKKIPHIFSTLKKKP